MDENSSTWIFGYGSLTWGSGPVQTTERRALNSEHFSQFIMKLVGGGCLLLGVLAPVWFGWKIMGPLQKGTTGLVR
jgi:hypothetical protein